VVELGVRERTKGGTADRRHFSKGVCDWSEAGVGVWQAVKKKKERKRKGRGKEEEEKERRRSWSEKTVFFPLTVSFPFPFSSSSMADPGGHLL